MSQWGRLSCCLMSLRKILFLFQGKGHECDYCGMLYNRTALKQHMEKHKKKGHLQVFKTCVICSVSWHIFRHFGFLDQRWANLFALRATLMSSASRTLPRSVLDHHRAVFFNLFEVKESLKQ